MNTLAKVKPASWLKFALYALFLLGIYYSTFTWLVLRDWAREDYDYCYLIPFIVLYLIWDKKESLFSLPSKPSWTGMVPLVIGVALFWLGELSGEFLSLYVSFWLVLVGICWIHIGWKKLKELGFALFMILPAFPLPNFLFGKVTFHLKLISSQLGVAMMRLFGMSAYREGNVIDLGFTQLQVVDACSGLRFVIPLIVLGIILAYFYKAGFWKRALLVISTVPLSIVTNSLRIALTGVIHELWGAEFAEGFFHGFSGWLIFMFSLAILLAEMWILSKVCPARTVAVPQKRRPVPPDERRVDPVSVIPDADQEEGEIVSREVGREKSIPASLGQPVSITAVVLLAATLALSHGIEFREKTPIKKPFASFPLAVGEWAGTRQTMEQKFIDELDLTDYVIVDYQNPQGRPVDFYVAYYASQRKGESIHSPATCLPGSGWIFKEEQVVSIPSPTGGVMQVNRAFMEKMGQRQLCYYWFPQQGRILTNAYQLKIYTFWNALTRQRTDAALVRIITPIDESEGVDQAEARLQTFTREMVTVLAEFLPE